MRTALYAAAIAAGVVLAQLGDRPLWLPAVIAVLAFPLAAASATAAVPGRRQVPLVAGLISALSGGVLVGLLVRLAIAAPDWQNAYGADCGAASTSTQDVVLWTAALLFALAIVPVGATLAGIGRRIGGRGPEAIPRTALSLYPLAVAGAGLGLIGASFATAC